MRALFLAALAALLFTSQAHAQQVPIGIITIDGNPSLINPAFKADCPELNTFFADGYDSFPLSVTMRFTATALEGTGPGATTFSLPHELNAETVAASNLKFQGRSFWLLIPDPNLQPTPVMFIDKANGYFEKPACNLMFIGVAALTFK